MSFGDVTRPDASRQVVGTRNQFLRFANRFSHDDRAEDLFAHDEHDTETKAVVVAL